MASLGSASLKLTTDNSGLTSGLQGASSKIASWGSSIGGSIGGALGSIASFTPMGAAIAGIGTAVAAVTRGFSRLTEIGNQTKTALSLGINPQQFQGLGLILQRAGIDASQTGEFFAGMAQRINRATETGAGPAARALRTLGVDMQALRTMPLDQQFLTIADAISKLPPGAEQAAVAMNAFGNAALLPQLQRGRAGLEEFIAKAKADGLILGETESKAAMEASKAWGDAKRSLSQAWDSISVSIAQALVPLVKVAADVFKSIVDFAKPIIRALTEYWQTMYEILGPVFEMIGEGFREAIAWVKSFFTETGVVFPSIRDITLNVFQAIATAGAYVWDTLKAGMGGLAIALGFIWENITGRILQGLHALLRYVVDKIPAAMRPGWLDNATRGLDSLQQRVRGAGADMQTWGRNAISSFGNSATATAAYFDRIRNRSRETIQEAVDGAHQIQQAMEQAAQVATAVQNKALIKGSADEYNMRVQWQNTGEVARQNNLTQQQLDVLRGIHQELRNGNNRRGQQLQVEEV